MLGGETQCDAAPVSRHHVTTQLVTFSDFKQRQAGPNYLAGGCVAP
jgi:hypothetical protein